MRHRITPKLISREPEPSQKDCPDLRKKWCATQYGLFLRFRDGRSQAEVAAVLGVTQQRISKIENGGGYFTDSQIEKLAVFFEVGVGEFYAIAEALHNTSLREVLDSTVRTLAQDVQESISTRDP